MIAVDTSTFLAHLKGDEKDDVLFLRDNLMRNNIILPPVVLTELLSGTKKKSQELELFLLSIPTLELSKDYWFKVGHLRAKILRAGYKAKLADSLIAQSCIDHSMPLITRDKDFKVFEKMGGLKLYQSVFH